jgi:hypothetical protein
MAELFILIQGSEIFFSIQMGLALANKHGAMVYASSNLVVV